jgi:diphthamide synthase subunit DPH2
MKQLKTITTAILLLCTVSAFSQTKEETVQYINDIVKISKGRYYPGNAEIVMLRQSFSLDLYYEQYKSVKRENICSITHTDIPWATLNKVEIIQAKNSKDLN